MPEPEVLAAFALLGLPTSADVETVRGIFRTLIISAHPDQAGPEAHESTIGLLTAYRLALNYAESTHKEAANTTTPTAANDNPVHSNGVWLADTDTIAMACTREEAFARIVEVGHLLGAITYLDRDGDLLEVLLRTKLGDTMSLVVSLQGRAQHIEAFITCEVLDVARHELPTVEQLTELYAHHLATRW